MKKVRHFALLLVVMLGLLSIASCKKVAKLHSNSTKTPEIFEAGNVNKAIAYMEKNISSQSNVFQNREKGKNYYSVPGCVVAASEGMFASWPRDAAIVMGTITNLYAEAIKENNEESVQKYGNYLINYVNWLKKTVPQEPADHAKFYIDGNKYPWMNQGDGPALRVITLSQMAEIFIETPQSITTPEGRKIDLNKEFIEKNCFGKGSNLSNRLVLHEMQFICQNWMNKTFDIWEESNGHHFFTERVQFKAALSAAILAKMFGKDIAAEEYLKTALAISKDLKTFYQKWCYYGIRHNLKEPLGSFMTYTENKKPAQKPFVGQPPANWYEKWERGSGLNSSVMLGAIYGDFIPELDRDSTGYRLLSDNKDYMELYNSYKKSLLDIAVTSDEVIQTVYYYQNSFSEKGINSYSEGLDPYKINSDAAKKGRKGFMVGRYPGDNYNGIDWSKVDVDGNPWILTTCNLARYYYMLAGYYEKSDKITIPSESSSTPDVIRFFRQVSGNSRIQPDRTYYKGDKVFQSIISGLLSSGNDIMDNLYTYLEDMRMPEQIDRNTGKYASYPNLTWSYSSFIDTYLQYKKSN